jgi:hypothetical protein
LITSALRVRKKWQWSSNKVGLSESDSPLGDAGRCAAIDITNGELRAVDCNQDQFLPLCELNLAKDCVTENGFYDGEVSHSVSGMNN